MKTLTFFAVALVVLVVAPASADKKDAATKAFSADKAFAKTCANCHGPTGAGMASFPRLSDKTKEHLVGRLKQYRAGEKVGPNTPLMKPHAVKLTDAEIEGLATYISAVLSQK